MTFAVASLLCSSGCSAISELAILPPIFAIQGTESLALNAIVNPRLAANAGPDALATVNQTVILNGSESGVILGSGTLSTTPTNPINFLWQVVSSPIPDKNGDGTVDAADLTAAGVKLDFATTAFPQFSSPIAGDYVIQLTAAWVDNYGLIQTSTDSAIVAVFATAQ